MKYSIAIVEDNPQFSDSVKGYLDKYGKENNVDFNVYSFTDGDEITSDYEAKYDIIFLDIEMKRLDGMSAAQKMIEQQRSELYKDVPKNLEEQAINLVGPEIYEKLIQGYTEKQWGKPCTELPAFIIKRLPVRFTFDNNYFNDTYQGIPKHGYTYLIQSMLKNVEVRLNMDFFDNRLLCESLADKIIYTGPIDKFYHYQYGPLEYRSLRFEHERLDMPNFQGNAVVNYTDKHIPYTRIIEHKHFNFGSQPVTFITKEYPEVWSKDKEPYYPVNDVNNNLIYEKYYQKSLKEKEYLFGGRLAEYKYYDMHIVIESALKLVDKIFNS